MYEDFVSELKDKLTQSKSAAHAENQLSTLHDEVKNRDNPVVLELGTQSGTSTKVFLNAIHSGEGGNLVSVDIMDCSSAANSPRWTFVQEDSANVEGVLQAAPLLRNGIDVLYIDSLHHVDHVRKELFGFFPYVKFGGVICFDDVDSLPYMRGRARDNFRIEAGNRAILNFLHTTFEDNTDKLYFTLDRGETGLARLTKRAELGVELSGQPQPRARYHRLYWKYRKSLEKRFSKLRPAKS